jgi:RNA polymerase subunit RPABC4/transcription elongation factor Spt4
MPKKFCKKCNKIIKAKDGGMCQKCTLEEYEKQKKGTADRVITPRSNF